MVGFKEWWTRDTPLHTYFFCSFLIGMPSTIFNACIIYQLQVVGFLIGTDAEGQPCTTYCIVPWGPTRLDLNSVLLYLNALAFGLGGVAALFLCAYSDFWSKKHLLVTLFIIFCGSFAIPAYWLQESDARTFASLMALYALFHTSAILLAAVLPIYVPHCMRDVRSDASVVKDNQERQSSDPVSSSWDMATSAKRKYAFNMSVLGNVASASGGVLMLIITIILSLTLTGTAAQSACLRVTTVAGCITVVGSVVAWSGLPALPSKPYSEVESRWTEPIAKFFAPMKELAARKSLGALLVAFTIYVDSSVTVTSVAGQLFVSHIQPSALEYSLYSLSRNLLYLIFPMIFLWLRPKLPVKLETWMIVGYCINLIVPIWGCVGIGDVDFGFKNRWEFYAQQVVVSIAQTFVNAAFRVLFSEMLPVGSEVQWSSMQVVLSCVTISINYIASAPLQNATHQLRFPLVLSMIFLMGSLAIEICRISLPIFTRDRQTWFERDQRRKETGVEAETDAIFVTL